MIKLRLLVILFLSLNNILVAQKKNCFSMDSVILNMPDSLATSSQNIANYINSNYISNENKLRAVFIWITDNIQYDINNMYNFNQAKDQIITQTLRTRVGVCQDYAELFTDIANKIGIKTYVVLGYTKQNNVVTYNPHAWCAAIIDSSWFLFDPTWGAGTIQDSEYIKDLDTEYFKMSPEFAIKTHMPFDPLWQFLEYPITNQIFCENRKIINDKKELFNSNDCLKAIEKQSYIDNLIAKKRRIENNVTNSYLVYTIIQQLDEKIENYFYNNVKMKYDSASIFYNEAIYKLNRFIDYRNKQFKPDKGDTYLIQMIDSVEQSFNLSLLYLNSIDKSYDIKESSLDHLYKSINAAMITFNEQKEFLDKFIKTSKNYRKSLFYDKM